MAATKIRNTLQQITLLIVFGLGLIVAVTMAGPSEENHGLPSLRRPASIDSRGATYDVKPEVGVIDLKCDQDTYQTPPVSQIQIRGLACHLAASDQVQETLILNETNGATATVFPTEQVKFLTDFMQLYEGTNHILVRQMLKSGRVQERHIVLTR